ncbi:hypothetical protein SAMN04515695_5525 [Pseudovibrio sp. Tun.PSC04-5.I4]|nr:hypothetical protein SAMN04515695_5525 [Pseudovibrio sp. Tun.PSC04-5.I4]
MKCGLLEAGMWRVRPPLASLLAPHSKGSCEVQRLIDELIMKGAQSAPFAKMTGRRRQALCQQLKRQAFHSPLPWLTGLDTEFSNTQASSLQCVPWPHRKDRCGLPRC